MIKVITVLGARPQFVKAAVVSRAFTKSENINEVIIHTGQHFDENMSDIFFEQMRIPQPNYNLNINGLGHGEMTGQMLSEIEKILISEQPEWVLVYGDTNSTLAGALAAKKLHINIAHVEAGLRSFNMDMPEEVNRILTDRVSNVLFCPSDTAMYNLDKEGYSNFDNVVVNVGDVMQDAVNYYSAEAKKPLFELNEHFVLCTIHRAENTDNHDKLRDIFDALREIAKGIQIVLPLHPRTKNKLMELGYDISQENITVVFPVGYFEMIYLINHSRYVMTDSGGLQKEAYMFRKFCITLREETEWIELVDNGYNVLVGSNYEKIIEAAKKFSEISISKGLYGDGYASEKICNFILKGKV